MSSIEWREISLTKWFCFHEKNTWNARVWRWIDSLLSCLEPSKRSSESGLERGVALGEGFFYMEIWWGKGIWKVAIKEGLSLVRGFSTWKCEGKIKVVIKEGLSLVRGFSTWKYEGKIKVVIKEGLSLVRGFSTWKYEGKIKVVIKEGLSLIKDFSTWKYKGKCFYK